MTDSYTFNPPDWKSHNRETSNDKRKTDKQCFDDLAIAYQSVHIND